MSQHAIMAVYPELICFSFDEMDFIENFFVDNKNMNSKFIY